MFHHSKSRNLDFSKLYQDAGQVLEKIPIVKERKRKRLIFRGIKYLSIFLISVFVLFLILTAIHFINLKMSYQEAFNGKENIEYALVLMREKKYSEAEKFSALAQENFRRSHASLERIQKNIFLRSFVLTRSSLGDLGDLLLAARTASNAALEASRLAADFEEITSGQKNFNALPIEKKKAFLENLRVSGPRLSAIRDDFSLACGKINNIKYSFILIPIRGRLLALSGRLDEVRKFLDKAVPLARLAPEFLGYPEQSAYLLLLQNSTELRPTGGFIGTYGIFEFQNGELVRHDTHDIYHMDMPVKDKFKIEPPPELKKYLGVDNWYMRDANWSPHWPISADKAEWFFYEENKLLPPKDQINNFSGKFDGVIGITPELVQDLLEVIGPLEIEGTVYTSENFTELLEYRVEKGYVELGESSWQRKEVIGRIFSEMKNRIFDLEIKSFYAVGNAIMENLSKKNILIYLHDPEQAAIIKEQGWSGEVKKTEGDYLMAVDANMAAFKTDAVMSRSIDYRVDQGANGLFADLKINYKHNGENFNWKTTRYRTYTRIYVPLDSQLVSAEGFSEPDIDVHNELGKTVFGGFLSIEPGQIGNLKVKYKLPDELAERAKSGSYDLLFQKQPGNSVESAEVELSFLKDIKTFEPIGFFADRKDGKIRWEGPLAADREYSVLLEAHP